MLLGDISRKNARLHPDRVAVRCGARTYTFGEIDRLANRVANALIDRGVSTGRRVAYLSKNSAEYPAMQFGIAKSGAAAVPLNFRLALPELAYILDDSEPSLLVYERDYRETVLALAADRPRLPCVELPSDDTVDVVAETDWLAKASDEEPRPRDIDEHDLLSIIYTSGTTGRPKGAMLTHRNTLWCCHNYALEFRLGPEEVGLHPLPLFHAGGGTIFLASAFTGSSAVIVRDFSPETVLELIDREGVTFVIFVPSMIIRLLEEPGLETREFRTLRLIMYGAAPMPPDRLQQAMRVFRCDFVNSFGQTEAGPAITCLRPREHHVAGPDGWLRLASIGRETYNVEARIVDAEGREVRPGEVGEIVCRSNSVMLGYWRQPEATAATIRDGWLHTGDLGTVDPDGYFYLTGRKKELIISGGENVYPVEVEQVLSAHPAVLEAAVVGAPHRLWGETVLAVVALREGHAVSEADLIDHCRGKLAGYKRPRAVRFVDALPRNASGKVLKHVLKEQLGQTPVE